MSTGPASTREPKRFTAPEAQDKIGRQVSLREEYAGIAAGNSGRVTQSAEIHPDFYDLLVEWDLPTTGQSSPSWFTQDEYERYIEEC